MTRGWHRQHFRHSRAARLGWSRRKGLNGDNRNQQAKFWRDSHKKLGKEFDSPNPRHLRRRLWYNAMIERGPAGIRDNRTRARTTLPLNQKNYEYWSKNERIRQAIDVEGIDTPINDIDEIKVHGVSIWVGSSDKDQRERTKELVRHVLRKNFTRAEVKKMNNVYVECVSRGKDEARHSGDEMKNKRRANIIELEPGHGEVALTHEFIHVLRWMQNQEKRIPVERNGESLPNITEVSDEDEKKTELETVGRVSKGGVVRYGKDPGYYAKIPHTNTALAAKSDRIKLTGSVNHSVKGQRVRDKVEKIYPKSSIKHATFDGE